MEELFWPLVIVTAGGVLSVATIAVCLAWILKTAASDAKDAAEAFVYRNDPERYERAQVMKRKRGETPQPGTRKRKHWSQVKELAHFDYIEVVEKEACAKCYRYDGKSSIVRLPLASYYAMLEGRDLVAEQMEAQDQKLTETPA